MERSSDFENNHISSNSITIPLILKLDNHILKIEKSDTGLKFILEDTINSDCYLGKLEGDLEKLTKYQFSSVEEAYQGFTKVSQTKSNDFGIKLTITKQIIYFAKSGPIDKLIEFPIEMKMVEEDRVDKLERKLLYLSKLLAESKSSSDPVMMIPWKKLDFGFDTTTTQASQITFGNNNKTAKTNQASVFNAIFGTQGINPNEPVYFEIKINQAMNSQIMVGWAISAIKANTTANLYNQRGSYSYYLINGQIYEKAKSRYGGGSILEKDDIIKVKIYKNLIFWEYEGEIIGKTKLMKTHENELFYPMCILYYKDDEIEIV